MTKAIASIDIVRRKNEQGGYDEIVKIRLVDKVRVLELLAKHQQLLQETADINVNTQVITLPSKVPVGTPVELDENGNIVSEMIEPENEGGDTEKRWSL